MPIRILHDSSDPVAAQMVAGMLQKEVMTSLPDAMAAAGNAVFRPGQRRPDAAAAPEPRIEPSNSGQCAARRQERPRRRPAIRRTGAVEMRDVVGEKSEAR